MDSDPSEKLLLFEGSDAVVLTKSNKFLNIIHLFLKRPENSDFAFE
jgi:hypothetical protein